MSKRSKQRTLAVDYGRARIGLATSDPTQSIASTMGVIKGGRTPVASALVLQKELEEMEKKGYQFERIVVGLPLYMDGNPSPMSLEVEQFVAALEKQIDMQVVTWDERLTSQQAERTLRESGMNRKKRTQYTDSVAASHLLQSYLDSPHVG